MNYNRIPLCALVLLTMVSACSDHRHGRWQPDDTRFALQVSRDGVGAGTVASSPSGVNCGTDCAEAYPSGTVVTLTASASSGSEFFGWSGACVGTGPCAVTMDAAKSVTASFGLLTHTLGVSKSGTGSGTVTTAPTGINCGDDCDEDYAPGTEVTLTASADSNSTFAGWSGSGCSGTGACVVTMSESTAITATFNAAAQIATHHVGGTIAGLAGTVVLQNNGTNDLSIASNGGFTFSNPIDVSAAYHVTILAQPATQTCSIATGSGIMGSADVTDVAVTCVDHPTTLSLSVSTLALATNCTPSSACGTTQSSALTGTPRIITVTNTGISPAINTSVASAGLPTDTSISSSTCSGAIAPGGSCAITITPGSIASSSCSAGIAPTPGTITVSADNSNTLVSNVLVLTFGCQYQGGFVYSIDDTTPDTGSIGGKVVSRVDQAAPYIGSGPQATSTLWSSNGGGSAPVNVSYDIIPLIAEVSGAGDSYAQAKGMFDSSYSNSSTFPFPSVSAFAACNGSVDGACNSNNILALYHSYRTGYGIGASPFTLSAGPSSTSDYAAGLCSATISGYDDWYLPAVCELDAANGACPAQTQGMSGHLSFLIGDQSASTPSTSCTPPAGTDCLAGGYWSSTASASNPQYFAWSNIFDVSAGFQASVVKDQALGARCSRALTH